MNMLDPFSSHKGHQPHLFAVCPVLFFVRPERVDWPVKPHREDGSIQSRDLVMSCSVEFLGRVFGQPWPVMSLISSRDKIINEESAEDINPSDLLWKPKKV
jgi:hypothetical protein